jgi:hypothetical protein
MSRVLGNVSVVGKNTYRKLTVPATASISSLTFSTDYVKGVLLTVTSSVVIREVTIYTQVGDSNHIDANNRFALIVASGSTVVNTYVGWQSSWNQSNYYNINNYTFSNLLNSTPLPQKLPLDIYLEKGTYEFYLDESFNIGFTPTQDNIKYILSTTASSFPYTDPNGIITVGTTSNTNKTRQGNIFFNWVVSDYDNMILEKGGLGIYNYLSDNQDKPLTITSDGSEIFSLSTKTYSTPLSSTISFIISPSITNTSYMFKLGLTTSYNSLYQLNSGYVYRGTSAGDGNWITYSQYADALQINPSNGSSFFTSGTWSSSFNGWKLTSGGWTQTAYAPTNSYGYLPPVTTDLMTCVIAYDADGAYSIYEAVVPWDQGRLRSRINSINTIYNQASATSDGGLKFNAINGQPALYFGKGQIQSSSGITWSGVDIMDNLNFASTQKITSFVLFSIVGTNSIGSLINQYTLTALDPYSLVNSSTHSFVIYYDNNLNLNLESFGDKGTNKITSNVTLNIGDIYLATAKLDTTISAPNQLSMNLTNLTTGLTSSFNTQSSTYSNTNFFSRSNYVASAGPSIGHRWNLGTNFYTPDANIGAVIYYKNLLSDSSIRSVEDWISLQYSYPIQIGVSGKSAINYKSVAYDVSSGLLTKKGYRLISTSGSNTRFLGVYGSYSHPGINITVI